MSDVNKLNEFLQWSLEQATRIEERVEQAKFDEDAAQLFYDLKDMAKGFLRVASELLKLSDVALEGAKTIRDRKLGGKSFEEH